MKKFLAGMFFILFASSAFAQNEQLVPALRITRDDSTGDLNNPPGALVNIGSTRLFKPVYFDTPLATDNAIMNPYTAAFKIRWDSNVSVGTIAQAIGYLGFSAARTAVAGENRLYFGTNQAGPGATSQMYTTDNGLWIGHLPGIAYGGRVSLANEGLLRYDITAQRWQVSTNTGAWGNLLRSGDTGIVTSVGLTMPTWFTVTGSPVTSSGTLAVTAATQTANTALRGPTTGAAAAPTFRAMVTADIVDKIVTGPKLALCTTGLIYKSNGTDMACAADDTSPGGASWLTGGNTLAAATAKLGSLDAFGFEMVANNVSFNSVTSTGGQTFHAAVASDVTSSHSFQGTGSSVGTLFGYYKMTQRSATLASPINPGASESVMYMDAADGHVYIKEGAAAAYQLGAASSNPTLAVPTGFAIAGSGTAAMTISYATRTWYTWNAQQGVQPATNFATFDTRNSHPVIDFTDATSDVMDFEGRIPEEWDGTTFETMITWAAATATTGAVRWECSIEREDAQDLDVDGFGTVVLVTSSATSATAGIVTNTSCSHSTSGTRDAVAAGDSFRLRIRRLGADAADTLSGAVHLLKVQIRKP